MNKKFSILITTKNRIEDLKITLTNLAYLVNRKNVEFLVYDDASTDGTLAFLESEYPNFKIFKNNKSLGYIYNRNVLLNSCQGDYAISLDDDAHFLSERVLENIQVYFSEHPKCGLLALRIFWGKYHPEFIETNEQPIRVKSFVGCGHVWNKKAWNDIPNYPEWFVFYGEENFASYCLFKKKWEIHYLPQVLVHHRVDLKSRKKNDDYLIRSQRALRAGWYLYFLFFPFQMIPRKMAYSIWIQFKLKVCKGDFIFLLVIVWALSDLFLSIPKIFKDSNRLTIDEYENYLKITDTKIYWQPEK